MRAAPPRRGRAGGRGSGLASRPRGGSGSVVRSPVPRVGLASPCLVLSIARGGRCCYSPHCTAGKLRAERGGVPGRPGGPWRCGAPAAPLPPGPGAEPWLRAAGTPLPPESHGPGICLLSQRRRGTCPHAARHAQHLEVHLPVKEAQSRGSVPPEPPGAAFRHQQTGLARALLSCTAWDPWEVDGIGALRSVLRGLSKE